MNLWSVRASGTEWDNHPRMPGNVSRGWHRYVVAASQKEALAQCSAEINTFNNSKYDDKEIVAELVTLENLVVSAKNPSQSPSGGFYTQKFHEVKINTPGWELAIVLRPE